ncbi:MAG: Do family serine endopeptidase [Bacteroidetes bacterium]|nr:Do family serine endopeptidase [Bacteroidota bacterium]
MKNLISLLLAAILGGLAAVGINRYLAGNEITGTTISVGNDSNHTSAQQPGQAQAQFAKLSVPPEQQIDFTRAAEVTLNAVVHVKSAYQYDRYYNPFYDFFWGYRQPSPQPVIQAGSGVIISEDGYIVTNNHVIDKAEEVEVALNDKRTYKAKFIGVDKTTDLALLKIDEKDLPYIMYGNSDEVKVGEWVLAVGNPFNLASTVTAGIVSAKGRDINIIPDQFKIESFIQTDAAVNPGNSGGALVNSAGELIGINTAIASNTGSYTGYSFAIPVNIVKKIVADLREFGSVQRAFLGISIRNLDQKLAQESGLTKPQGVHVSGINENSAADEAGMKEGDVIVRINDVALDNVAALQEQVAQHRPGDRILVTIVRKGKESVLPVVLRNREGTTDLMKSPVRENVSVLGAVFEPLQEDDMKRLGIDCGVKIAQLKGGKLLGAGIREGFIITKIDRKKIFSAEDVTAALENKKGGVLIEGVYPNGMKGYYGFGL